MLNHWRQGDALRKQDTPLNFNQDARVVVTPYSCALARATGSDLIDVLLLHQCTKTFGFENGRSPKKIQISVELNGNNVWFEATTNDRNFIPAHTLANLKPEEHWKISESELRAISYWHAARFTRTAFPDAFNEAWKPQQKVIRGHLAHLQCCRLILVNFKLLPDGRFKSDFQIVMEKEIVGDSEQWPLANMIAQKLEQCFCACEKMLETSVVVTSTDALSLDAYLSSYHFDAFDDVSIAESHVGPVNSRL